MILKIQTPNRSVNVRIKKVTFVDVDAGRITRWRARAGRLETGGNTALQAFRRIIVLLLDRLN